MPKTDKPPSIALHRFRDCGAIALLNCGGPTLYFDAKAARQLAKAAARLARSLEREAFRDSAYGNAGIPASLQAGE